MWRVDGAALGVIFNGGFFIRGVLWGFGAGNIISQMVMGFPLMQPALHSSVLDRELSDFEIPSLIVDVRAGVGLGDTLSLDRCETVTFQLIGLLEELFDKRKLFYQLVVPFALLLLALSALLLPRAGLRRKLVPESVVSMQISPAIIAAMAILRHDETIHCEKTMASSFSLRVMLSHMSVG